MRERPRDPSRVRLVLALLALVLAVAGCLGDKTLEEVDPEAAPAEPTYEAHIAPLMADRCNTCHDPDAAGGEQGGIRLDECEELQRHLPLVEEMVFDREVMPPGGAERLTNEELLTFRRWIDQGADCGQ